MITVIVFILQNKRGLPKGNLFTFPLIKMDRISASVQDALIGVTLLPQKKKKTTTKSTLKTKNKQLKKQSHYIKQQFSDITA